MGSRIVATGRALPRTAVTNHDLARIVDTSDEWVRTRTGIERRYVMSSGESLVDIAAQASTIALQRAGIKSSELDAIIVGTVSSEYGFPSFACQLQHRLGVDSIPAYDVAAACSGFVYALNVADNAMRAGEYSRVLLVGTDALSTMVDWNDRAVSVLFGDGAGAAVIGPSDSGAGVGPIDLTADGGLGDTIVATFDDGKIRMDGISTFKIAVKRLSESTVYAVSAAGLELDDIDLFVYHQANARIIKAVGERLDLEPAKVADYISQLGNTSAASVPLTLSLAREDGRLRPGHRVLLAAIGAGFTWGAGVMEWTAQ
jgi:3-oxoacyl-[acyl-carrier-protein] synthase-3